MHAFPQTRKEQRARGKIVRNLLLKQTPKGRLKMLDLLFTWAATIFFKWYLDNMIHFYKMKAGIPS